MKAPLIMLIVPAIITRIQITPIVSIIVFIANFWIFGSLARIIDFVPARAPLSSLALKPRLIRVSLNLINPTFWKMIFVRESAIVALPIYKTFITPVAPEISSGLTSIIATK